MTYNEFVSKVMSVFPNAMIGTDNDCQLIVYTNLIENRGPGDEVIPIDNPNLTGV